MNMDNERQEWTAIEFGCIRVSRHKNDDGCEYYIATRNDFNLLLSVEGATPLDAMRNLLRELYVKKAVMDETISALIECVEVKNKEA